MFSSVFAAIVEYVEFGIRSVNCPLVTVSPIPKLAKSRSKSTCPDVLSLGDQYIVVVKSDVPSQSDGTGNDHLTRLLSVSSNLITGLLPPPTEPIVAEVLIPPFISNAMSLVGAVAVGVVISFQIADVAVSSTDTNVLSVAVFVHIVPIP